MVQVTYLELRAAPLPPAERAGTETVGLEKLATLDYLLLYRRVGESVLWDQRLQMLPQIIAARNPLENPINTSNPISTRYIAPIPSSDMSLDPQWTQNAGY